MMDLLAAVDTLDALESCAIEAVECLEEAELDNKFPSSPCKKYI